VLSLLHNWTKRRPITRRFLRLHSSTAIKIAPLSYFLSLKAAKEINPRVSPGFTPSPHFCSLCVYLSFFPPPSYFSSFYFQLLAPHLLGASFGCHRYNLSVTSSRGSDVITRSDAGTQLLLFALRAGSRNLEKCGLHHVVGYSCLPLSNPSLSFWTKSSWDSGCLVSWRQCWSRDWCSWLIGS
jgi:hypothetical protein